MREKNLTLVGMFLLVGVFLMGLLSASYFGSNSYSSSNPNYGNFAGFVNIGSSSFNTDKCEAGQDFILQIAPFGCTPAVVRSDLLEEQNVPVFCQVAATKINPLIDVNAIESISFSGQYPSSISGVGFYPARAALGVSGDINRPVLDNIGYVVIVLKEQNNESSMPDFVEGNLTARLNYDIKNAFGIGKATFYLPYLTGSEFEDVKNQYSFWGGKGYLKAEEIGINDAAISIYNDINKIFTVRLEKGATSDKISMPGFDCNAKMELKLDDLTNPDTMAKFDINGEKVQAIKGEKFLDNKCEVRDVQKNGINQKVILKCNEDESSGLFGKPFELEIRPKISLEIDGKSGEYEVGDYLYEDSSSKKFVYLGYIGTDSKMENPYSYFVSISEKRIEGKLTAGELNSIVSLVNKLEQKKVSNIGMVNALNDMGNVYLAGGTLLYDALIKNKGIRRLGSLESDAIFDKTIKLNGFAGAQDKSLGTTDVQQEFYVVDWGETDPNQMGFTGFAKIKKSGTGEDTGLYVIKLGAMIDYKIGENCRLEEDTSIERISSVSPRCEKYYGDFESPDSDWYYFDANTIKTSDKTDSYNKFFNNIQKIKLSKSIRQIILDRRISKGDSPDTGILDNYQNALTDYDTVIKNYGNEKISDKLTYGEEALKKKILLANEFGQKKTMLDLCKTFKEKYSESQSPFVCSDEVKISSSTSFSRDASINGNLKTITFEGIYEPSFEDYGVQVVVRGPNKRQETLNLEKNEIFYLNDFRTEEDLNEYIQLTSLTEKSATFNYYIRSESRVGEGIKSGFSNYKETLSEDVSKSLSGYTFTLIDVNLKKLAKVSVIPNIDNVGTSANFSFKIGIEKRAIQLSPEKTQKKIDSLNETIAKWEDRSEKLGNVVQGLKGACLATGAGLMVKNFFANTGGKGIARQEVMRGTNGWYEKCSNLVSKEKKYGSVEECLLDKSDDIDKDVEQYFSAMEKQNTELKNAQAGCDKTEFLTETHINTDCFKNNYFNTNQNELKGLGTIKCGKDDVNANDFFGKINSTQFSTDELRSLVLYSRLKETNGAGSLADTRLQSTFCDVYANNKMEIEVNELTKTLNEKIGLKNVGFNYGKDKDAQQKIYHGGVSSENGFGGISSNVPVEAFEFEGQKYLLELQKDKGDEFSVKSVYSLEGISQTNSDELVKKINNKFSFKQYTQDSYNNKYENPELKYYETEPYNGLPALVPFNVNNGWYASVKQTLPVGGSIASYDASGRVSSFWLCNVGENKREENRGGDDICQQVNFGTGQPYNQFSGIEDTNEVSKLVRCAQDAVEKASKAYKSGVSQVKIITNCGTVTLKVGAPAADIPDMQCQDFMSPSDCKLLFNVCDPVICPSSRCDFGGAYPVKDVIQSGIIGSILLCLPNWNEGIYMPICLTGIKAGIDGLLSVYTSYRDCLQESLDTGKMVGICDEVYSIYMCEFMWKQALPVANIAIPKMIEMVLGQNIKGGGEYLGVASAWDTASKSVDYFTSYYAQNSFVAFKARSAEQVGGEICKNFASGVYPSGGNVFDKLTQPDSPPQFHGRFDEIPFTSATVPPISQYKVFYHIFAGKDSRAYYRVYLKGSTGGSYYQDTNYDKVVAQGYIATGGYASETVDFTAPTGYKELCIRVNDQEECGFQQSSTSYAVNYITDSYAAEQASQTDIKSEAECVSGSASAYSLLNPNLQSGVEGIIDTKLYDKGITRICATENPGKGTDGNYGSETMRWVDVGYCGDKNIKCWLDKESVADVIKDKNIENQTLQTVTKQAVAELQAGSKYTSGQVTDVLREAENLGSGNPAKVITELNNIVDSVFINAQKARLLMLRGGAYGELATLAKKKIDDAKAAVDAARLSAEIAKDYEELDYDEGGIGGECSKAICKESFGSNPNFEGNVKSEEVCRQKYPHGKYIIDYLENNECCCYQKVEDFRVQQVSYFEDFSFTNVNEYNLRQTVTNLGYPLCSDYAKLVIDASTTSKINNPLFLMAVVMQESSCDKNEINGNSIGLMQISTKWWCSSEYALSENKEDCKDELLNPMTNMNVGARILGKYYNDYGIKYENYKTQVNNNCQDSDLNKEYLSYNGWSAVLRAYNGFDCDSSGADNDYIKNVGERYVKLVLEYKKLPNAPKTTSA